MPMLNCASMLLRTFEGPEFTQEARSGGEEFHGCERNKEQLVDFVTLQSQIDADAELDGFGIRG